MGDKQNNKEGQKGMISGSEGSKWMDIYTCVKMQTRDYPIMYLVGEKSGCRWCVLREMVFCQGQVGVFRCVVVVIVGCWLVGCWLLAVGCWWLAVGWLFFCLGAKIIFLEKSKTK